MAFNYTVTAIQSLDPKAEFIIQGDDLSTIEWHVLTGEAPTPAEITQAIEAIKAEEKAEELRLATSKAALLERLGMTPEEAKLLLS